VCLGSMRRRKQGTLPFLSPAGVLTPFNLNKALGGYRSPVALAAGCGPSP
jgi:hypothetical protein